MRPTLAAMSLCTKGATFHSYVSIERGRGEGKGKEEGRK